jgi:hypothetical protein
MKYQLIMSNEQGASETTYHDKKWQIREQIRKWHHIKSRMMKAHVLKIVRDETGKAIGNEEIYSGSALSF